MAKAKKAEAPAAADAGKRRTVYVRLNCIVTDHFLSFSPFYNDEWREKKFQCAKHRST